MLSYKKEVRTKSDVLIIMFNYMYQKNHNDQLGTHFVLLNILCIFNVPSAPGNAMIYLNPPVLGMQFPKECEGLNC